MPTSRIRTLFSILASVGLCIGLAACSSCDGGNGGGDLGTLDGGDVGPETGGGDDADGGGGGCSSDDDCSGTTPACNTETNECVECTGNDHCGSGQICNTDDNVCKDTQCGDGSAGESCDPNAKTGQGWECVDAGKGPVCLRSCSMEDGSSCQGSEICMQRGDGPGTAVCFTSQCQGPSDTQNCSGVENHPRFGSYDNGAKCVEYSENAQLPRDVSDSLEDCGSASLCVPAGTQGTGDSCNIVTNADCPADTDCQACNAANTCQGGVCRSICTADSDCSKANETCVGLDDSDVVGDSSGFCAEACNPFDGKDDCSDSQQGCKRVTKEVGYCGPVGSKTNMEECVRGENECAEGFNCLGVRGTAAGVVARCFPTCALPEASDEETLDNHATCGGTYYGRAAYAHDDPASIDIYGNGNRLIDDLAPGDTDSGTADDYFEMDVDGLDHGFVDVAVTEGSATDAMNPELDTDVTASGGLVETWLVHWDGQLSITPIFEVRGVAQPAMGSGMAKARAGTVVPDFKANGSSVDVDIVAVPQGGSLSADAVVLAEELDGSASVVSSEFVELQTGTYRLFVFPESADHQSGNELIELSGFSLGAQERATFVLSGTADGSDSVDISGTKLPYASAPDAARYRCIGFGAGHCLNQCRTEDFGTDWCDENSSCDPLQGATSPSYCLPDGASTQSPGDSCSPSTIAPTCEEGAHCSVDGSGSGTCRSLCIGGDDDSDGFLTCESGNTCAAGDGELGECRTTCMPGNNQKDTSCPDNLKACITRIAGGSDTKESFCSPSGSKAKGETCGGSGRPLTSLNQNCEPGTMCAHATGIKESLTLSLQGMFLRKPPVSTGVCRQTVENPMAPKATCRQTCKPFAQDPGCPDGQACGLDLVNLTPLNGVCLEKGENISSPASEEQCGEAIGKMCGDHSYCLPNPVSGGVIRRCFEFCNSNTGKGCTKGDCEDLAGFGSGIGLCRL